MTQPIRQRRGRLIPASDRPKIAEKRTAVSRQSGSSRTVASRRGEAICLLARDDQALAGHDHPAAVLAADGVDAAEARDGIAGIDFVRCPAGLRSARRHWRRRAAPSLPPSAACRLRPSARAAGAAAAGGAIEPVTSFAAAGAAAARRRRGAAGAARSLSTASLSLASLAAGSACAFSTLSRRSLVLLNWVMPILEVCSTLALSAGYRRRSAPPEASSALVAGGLVCIAAGRNGRETRGRQRAAERARHRRQRHHGRQRRRAGACRTCRNPARMPLRRRRRRAVPGAVAGRHDHDLAGSARRFRPCGFDFGALGSFRLGGIGLGRIHLDGTDGCALFGHQGGNSTLTGSWPRPPPARSALPMMRKRPARRPREPVSPLICSALLFAHVQNLQ